MEMRMPHMAGMDHPGGGHHGPPIALLAIALFHMLLCFASTVCFLGALNRGASALKLEARIRALKAVPEAFTDEERVVLIHKITTRALGPM
jgi:hypothetical protein